VRKHGEVLQHPVPAPAPSTVRGSRTRASRDRTTGVRVWKTGPAPRTSRRGRAPHSWRSVAASSADWPAPTTQTSFPARCA
jgi:hypothetical protein